MVNIANEARLISNKEFLDSVRHLGITTIEAICELVDNSLDAKAQNVYIRIIEEKINGKRNISILIEDDGIGIKKEDLSKVLSFGGRISDGTLFKIGRFGWGLPSSACCQSIRTEVYSKTNGIWYYSYIDLNELKLKDEPILPDVIEQNPPLTIPLCLTESKTGTLIYLKNCDNLQYKKADTIVSNLMPYLGEVYRKYIKMGRNIFVNNTIVTIIDPLMLMDGALYIDIVGKAKELWPKKVIQIPDVIDDTTGRPAEIEIKVVMMDLDKIRKNLDWIKISTRVGFNIENQGFYLMRHNRQIARALTLTLPNYHKHNDFNYFRAEVSFPSSLDDKFGIQTNKSRFSIDSEIRDQIFEYIKDILSEIRTKTIKFRQAAKAGKNLCGDKISIEVVKTVNPSLKPDAVNPETKELTTISIEHENQKQKLLREINENTDLSEKEKEYKIIQINEYFKIKTPYVLTVAEIPDGNFYSLRSNSNATEVILNSLHPFYNLYEKAKDDQLDGYLDLLIFTLAKAERIYYDDKPIREFYKLQRKEWSEILSAYLSEYDRSVGDEDDITD